MIRKWDHTDLQTLDELQEQMERFSESNEAYSTKWLMKKLKDRYSDHLCFAEINVRKNVFCFKNMANCKDNSGRNHKFKLSLDSYPNK